MGVATWELSIPGAGSLKDKRMVVRSLKDRIRVKFNVSVAETALQEAHARAEISVALVATDTQFVDSVLTKVDRLVASETRARVVGTSRDIW